MPQMKCSSGVAQPHDQGGMPPSDDQVRVALANAVALGRALWSAVTLRAFGVHLAKAVCRDLLTALSMCC